MSFGVISHACSTIFCSTSAAKALQQALVFVHGCAQLSPHRFRVFAQQGHVAVGGAAGEQVEHALLLQRLEATDQIPIAVLPALEVALKAALQMVGSGFAIAGGLLQKLQAGLNPAREAFVECAVCKQRQEGR